ncbi:MAG: DUF6804 family protein [Candidatus Hodarchaeota archaeon]
MSKEKSNKESFGFIVVRVFGIAMLLKALTPNPYGYYTLLRWIVCALFAYCAVRAHKISNDVWIWIFGVSAAIYNPIHPLHLGRSIWSFVNIASVVVIIASFFILKQKIEVGNEDA